MILSPHDFNAAWGADALISLPSPVGHAIPPGGREFLTQAGLPAFIRYFAGSFNGVITFCRLAGGLSPVLGEMTVGAPLPKEWVAYCVIGDEFFCNGSAWWCIHDQTGEVHRIDIELERPIEFANSSVAQLASALLAAVSWSSRQSKSVEEWPVDVDRLKRSVAALDPASMASERNFWPAYLNFLRDQGPHTGAFEKGSRSNGEQTLKTRSW